MGWIGDCFGSLESVGCLSDLELGVESCLGGVCLGVFFLWVFRLYTAAPMLCSSLTGLCSSCAETWLLINFCHFKKKLSSSSHNLQFNSLFLQLSSSSSLNNAIFNLHDIFSSSSEDEFSQSPCKIKHHP
jgi:hypothetical protein